MTALLTVMAIVIGAAAGVTFGAWLTDCRPRKSDR